MDQGAVSISAAVAIASQPPAEQTRILGMEKAERREIINDIRKTKAEKAAAEQLGENCPSPAEVGKKSPRQKKIEEKAYERMVKALSYVQGISLGFETFNLSAACAFCPKEGLKHWGGVCTTLAQFFRLWAQKLEEALDERLNGFADGA
jgi:hypothetical protein